MSIPPGVCPTYWGSSGCHSKKCPRRHVPRPKGKICHNYWAAKSCRFESRCRFEHRYHKESIVESQKPKRLSTQDQPRQSSFFRYFVRKNREFKSEKDMQRFVAHALNDSDYDDVVSALASNTGLDQLEFILQAFVASRGRGFLNTILPLCELLTHDHFCRSPLQSATASIYNLVSNERNQLFPLLATKASDVLKGNGSLSASTLRSGETFKVRDSAKGVLLPILKLYRLLLSRVPDVLADSRFTLLFAELNMLCNRQERNIELFRVTSLCSSILNDCQPVVTPDDNCEHQNSNKSGNNASAGVFFELESESFNERKPQHDNDLADFRQICIEPSDAEIRCEVEPYLPRLHNGSSHVVNQVDRYLDIQFRLLREDMLAPLRVVIQQYLKLAANRRGVRGNQVKCHRIQFEKENRSSTKLMVYRAVSLVTLACSLSKGSELELQFSQLEHVKQKESKQKREQFWKETGSGQLQQGSLVCLVYSSAMKNQEIVFGTVSTRDPKELSGKEYASIRIKLLDSTRLAQLPNLLSNSKESVLLQVRGHFFPGYKPILKALQQHKSDTLPFKQIIVSPDAECAEINIRPDYLPEEASLDLSCIAEKGKQQTDLKNVPVRNYKQLSSYLHEFPGKLAIDDTQIEAFALALTRPVSLIQGPPGTGKSYVGVHVVRALLDNKRRYSQDDEAYERIGSSILPILCICYTNHALDQFLEDLIEHGVPKNQVIRMGARTKSSTLKSRTLYNLAPKDRSPFEFKRYKELKNKILTISRKILHLSEKCQNIKNKHVLAWLEDEHEELYHTITGPDSDGFHRVGEKNSFSFQTFPHVPAAGNMHRQVDLGLLHSESEEPNTSEPSLLGEEDHRESENEHVVRLEDILNNGAEKNEERETRDPQILLDHHVATFWEWSRTEKQNVWKQLKKSYRENIEKNLASAVNKLERLNQEKNELNSTNHLRVLRQAAVVGVTTSAAAINRPLLDALGARVLVCEEAGEVLESHILGAISSNTQQLVLIGDHQQLRPKVSEYSLSVESGRGHDLNLSMFERLVRKYDSADSALVTLLTQRRMRPEIAELIRSTLYPRLRDCPSVEQHPPLQGFKESLWFVDHGWREQSQDAGSYRNPIEAEFVVKLAKYAMRQGYLGERRLAVLTPYVGQLQLLQERLSKEKMRLVMSDRDLEELELAKKEGDCRENISVGDGVRLATVDNFQGEEADFVILSTVRCNPEGRIGFLREDNRVNVMLSRARHGMVILGSRQTVQRRMSSREFLFSRVLDRLNRDGRIATHLTLTCPVHATERQVSCPAHVPLDGGCELACGTRLKCGHACPRNCHPDDRDHRATCNEPCMRLIPECQHPCRQRCGAKCGNCDVKVERELPCGHVKKFKCSKTDWMNDECTVLVPGVRLKCGHTVELPCNKTKRMQDEFTEDHPTFSCNRTCEGLLQCGHQCKARCGECCWLTFESKTTISPGAEPVKHQPCQKPCDRNLMCGHQCSHSPCHDAADCPPCSKACLTKCVHSRCNRNCVEECPSCAELCIWKCTCIEPKEPCELPCGSPCMRAPCNKRCNRFLSCGHQCPTVCGELCPTAKYCRDCGTEGSQVVDLIELERYEEVDLDKNPVVVLKYCGHVFTTATLDGFFELDVVYNKNEDGEYNSPKPLDRLLKRPVCPGCRSPISNVLRYGRVLKFVELELSNRKFGLRYEQKMKAIVDRVNTRITRYQDQQAEKPVASRSRGANKDNDKAIVKAISKYVEYANQVFNDYKSKNPFQLMWEMESRTAVDVSPLEYNLSFQTSAVLQLDLGHCLKAQARICYRSLATYGVAVEAYEKCCATLEKATEICAKMKSFNTCQTGQVMLCVAHLEFLEYLQDEIRAGSLHNRQERMKVIEVLESQVNELLQRPITEKNEAAVKAIRTELLEWKSLGQVKYCKVSLTEKKEVLKAMQVDVGSGIGSFGGHWYQCPNGHVYTIGECGGATETSVCPECGEIIGGTSHELLQTNNVAIDFLKEVDENLISTKFKTLLN